MAAPRKRRTWGAIRKLPSGRFQAKYPDPRNPADYITAGTVFLTRPDAEAWLDLRHAEIIESRWKPPVLSTESFIEFAEVWLRTRRNRDGQLLAPGTVKLYDSMFRNHVYPAKWASMPMLEVTPGHIQTWFDRLKTGDARRLDIFQTVRTVFTSAVRRKLATANPCMDIEGVGKADASIHITACSPEQVAALRTATNGS